MIRKLLIKGLILVSAFTAGRIYQNSKLTLEKNIAKVENALKDDKIRDDILKRLIRPDLVSYGNRILVDNLEEGLIKNSPNSDIYFQRILTTGIRSGYDITKVSHEVKDSDKTKESRVRNFFSYLVESINNLAD
jgi:hypothetical protein